MWALSEEDSDIYRNKYPQLQRSTGIMQEYNHLDVSLEDDVFRIAFDRPDRLNAVNADVHEELAEVFESAYDSDAAVVVLTGNGDTFSAGGDIDWLQDSIDEPEEFYRTVRQAEEIIESILNLEKPVIARLNGDAVGGGATYALFCDIVIAEESARIGDPHVQVGLAAGDGGAVIWPLLTSFNKAKEYLMTGELMPAEEAHDIGLINHVVPEDELDAKVDEMIQKLKSRPTMAVKYTKMALNEWGEFAASLVLRESLALEGFSQKHPDHEAAVEAFLDQENR